jgi:hypothetical protein
MFQRLPKDAPTSRQAALRWQPGCHYVSLTRLFPSDSLAQLRPKRLQTTACHKLLRDPHEQPKVNEHDPLPDSIDLHSALPVQFDQKYSSRPNLSRRRQPDGGIRAANPPLDRWTTQSCCATTGHNNAIDSMRQLFISFRRRDGAVYRHCAAVYTSNQSVARYPLYHPAEAKGVKQGGGDGGG